LELVQNAKDEDGVTEIEMTLEMEPGRPVANFSIKDNSPTGFDDLSHAYTLFAPSYKLAKAEKSGWMNLGEKMVVVGCQNMTIYTTKGTVTFDMKEQSRTEDFRRKRPIGTEVSGTLRMNREEYTEAIDIIRSVLLPTSVKFTLNGALLSPRQPLKTFRAKLDTRILNEQGESSRSVRDTDVQVYEALPGEEPSIYELGIPVCANGGKWHVNVLQKVPLNKDRDSVPKA
jgi:hypothetical protein